MILDEIEYFEIPNYNEYLISKCGKIFSIKSNRLLKPCFRKSVGYYYANTCINSVRKSESIHRLLCFAFKPNPESKRCVNHINSIRTDNRLENLEWATYSENNHHAFVMGNKTGIGKRNPFARKIIDTSTNIIYDCIKDCANTLNINYAKLRKAVCKSQDNKLLANRFKYF